ncbi:phosphatase PAP2 family protein [Sulfuricaulis sp.]|uniref:phosphatase PAP2 family protein n=1 Tax=Sulfuricaulis sp. TaxID=2003553 RepID=UPI003559C300
MLTGIAEIKKGGNLLTAIFSLKSRTIVLLVTVSLTAISYFYFDTGIAQFVFRILNSSDRLLQTAADIPDLLLHIVIAITVSSWVGYFILVRRGICNHLTDFLRVCGTVVPMAFVAKTGLQYVFGRPDPYAWLLAHEPPRFYWFRDDEGYGCFPSGHMTVFTALMTTLSYYYPRYRPIYLGLLWLLALALIITDHHFLSDVLAGAVLGSVLAFITIKFARETGAKTV